MLRPLTTWVVPDIDDRGTMSFNEFRKVREATWLPDRR